MAGNQELIDTIVDPIAVKQVDDLNLKIQQLEATFIAASKSALAFNSAAGGSTTNSAFVKNVNESTKATQKLIETKEKLGKTIISNSQLEVDAYNKSKQGEEGITTTVNKRNRAEAQAANEATARSGKALKQSEQQAKEYVRAQGLIERLTAKLKYYKQAQIEATDPRAVALYAKKIQDTEKNITQLSNAGKDGFDSLGNAVKKSGNLFQSIGQKIVTLARILPGIGVVGLIAFATEPIMEYIASLNIFTKKITDAQKLVKELNDVNQNASKQFADQSTKLRILYETATDVNNSYAVRLSATRELQQAFPKTFENLTKEEIMNGKVGKSVKELTEDLLQQAVARASLDKITELEAKKQEIRFQKEKIRIANVNENAKTEADLSKRTVDAINFRNKQLGKAPLTPAQIKNLNIGVYLAENNKSTAKELSEADKNIEKLQKQQDFFAKNIKPENVEQIFGDGDGGAADEAARKKRDADAKRRAAELLKQAEEDYKLQLENEKTALDARTRLLEDYFDNEKKLIKDEEDSVAESNNARLANIEEYTSKELDMLVALYQTKVITEKEFNERREVLERDAALQSIDSAITLAEELLEINGSTQDEEDKLAKLRIQRSKLVRDNVINDIKKEAEARKQLKDLTKQVAEEAAQFVITLVNAGFENRKNKIQEQINLTDENAKAEIDAVNRSLISTSEKADKVKLIEAQADAQKKQLQREQKRVDQEKAKFDKAISLARIIQATAEAEISALSYLANPVTAPLYPGIAALIAALGAIQLATVLATPIPAYEKGTHNAKGGTSLVGEKGAEYVITPQGATFLTPGKPTLMDIPKGSTVIPHLETVRMMDVKNYVGGVQTDMSGVIQAINKKQFTAKGSRVNGWLSEMKAAQTNLDRRKNYFN